MATTTTTIKVTADTRDAQRALSDLQTSLGRLASVGAITALGTAFVKIADEATNLSNRLRVVSATNAEVSTRFAEVLNIANASRAPLKDVGDLYASMTMSASQFGVSQADVAMVVERVSKSLATSGVTAQEASGSLLQLKQAFQSGKFQGDELRSILESMPQVAQAMSRSLGVTVGALRYMGSQGQITSQMFVEAMRTAGKSIDDAFNKTIPTVGQSLTVLQNKVTNFVGVLDKQTGISDKLSQAIIKIGDSLDSLSKNVDLVINAMKILASIAVFVFMQTFAGKIGGAILSIAGGLRNLALMFASAGQQASSVGRVFSALGLNLSKFIDYTIATWKSWRTMVTGMGQASGPITGIFDALFRGIFLTIDRVVRTVAYAVKNLWGGIALMASGMAGFLDPVIAWLKDTFGWVTAIVDKVQGVFGKKAEAPAVTVGTPTGSGPRGQIGEGRAAEELRLLDDKLLKTEEQVKKEQILKKATIDRGIELRKIIKDQEQALGLTRLEGVELTIQQAINQANSQLIKEIKNDKGDIIGMTQGLSKAEESVLRNLILQIEQQRLQREVSKDLKSAQEDLTTYQTKGLGMSQAQLAIEAKVAEFRRNNVGLATKELEAQVRAAEVARQRLAMEQNINGAYRAASENLGYYKSNITGMTGNQLDVEMKILEAQRQYGDLLTDELKQKIRSTAEDEKQLDYLRQMKQGVEAVLKVLKGPEAGAMAAGQLGNLLPVDAAMTQAQSLMNGLQELRNQDLINEQQYQDAKVAANAQAMEAMYNATKKKFEGEQTLRIQALVGDKFSFDSIKSMASDAAAFQMKTDLEKTQFGIDQAAQLFSAAGKENKKAFEAAKAFNIASAVMNTYMAATKALATYPFPFGLIAAAAAVAAGMAQVSAIRAQTYSGRALGGPVMGNESYLVGERGPEIFTPATSGKITRNNQIEQGQPVTVNFNISTVDASGFDSLLVQRRGLITSMIADAQLEKGRRG